uniref:30S ribosomal protein S11 n=1 Tax=Lotharella vacuolata TaxID=74820 RepID=A0A140JZU6_9EUKA|nr:30S ribosomal protein S11 [Lotharella vacuolata]BAU62623.1 30S ribosomal protein S11 [Lotharella vacuolata]
MVKYIRKLTIKKAKWKAADGIVYIYTTLNNTIVTVVDMTGRVVSSSSAGICGFKGARKSSPFAAKTAAESAAKQCLNSGVKNAQVLLKGPGTGRSTSLRGLQEVGLKIALIKDVTVNPHNGCRQPKKRRV